MELEYEGELKGGDAVARELIRVAVGKVYDKYFEGANVSQIVQWFDLGGTLKLDESVDSAAHGAGSWDRIQGLMEKTQGAGACGQRAGRGARFGRRVYAGRACTRIAASAATKSADSARRERKTARRSRAATNRRQRQLGGRSTSESAVQTETLR